MGLISDRLAPTWVPHVVVLLHGCLVIPSDIEVQPAVTPRDKDLLTEPNLSHLAAPNGPQILIRPWGAKVLVSLPGPCHGTGVDSKL